MLNASRNSRNATLYLLVALGALATANCSGRGMCPPHGQMVTGATCYGEQLQCPYGVSITACDGTTSTIVSSCSCENGKWACPDPGTPDCSGVDGGTSKASAGGSNGTGLVRPSTPPKPSSCPYLFAWNGSEFEYQTDVEGEVVGLPASAAVNRGMPLYHSSHVKLPTAQFDSDNGIELRIRETIAETTYFDRARLLLVDHPAGYEVWPSSAESTYEWGYIEPFKLYTTKNASVPISAIDKNGNDVLAYVADLDNTPAPVDANGLDEFTFDFGPIQDLANVKLLLDAWAVYKIPTTLDVQPYVEAQDAQGQWQFIRKFGPTAGDLKTVVVDLSGLLPSSTQLLRVHLGVWAPGRLVLDRIRLDDSAPVDVAQTYLEAASAELIHRGRATTVSSSFAHHISAADDENPDDPNDYTFGTFTRYGDVLALLGAADDEYAIMRHGDQITLQFPGAPPPPDGWARTVLIEADTFYKVMLDPTVTYYVEPLPFHGMLQYPYAAPQAYPSDSAHEDYIQTYNTRVINP